MEMEIDRINQKLELHSDRLSTLERRMDAVEHRDAYFNEKLDSIKQGISEQLADLREALKRDRDANQKEFAKWQDHVTWFLRAIFGAVVIAAVAFVIGGGLLIRNTASAEMPAPHPVAIHDNQSAPQGANR